MYFHEKNLMYFHFLFQYWVSGCYVGFWLQILCWLSDEVTSAERGWKREWLLLWIPSRSSTSGCTRRGQLFVYMHFCLCLITAGARKIIKILGQKNSWNEINQFDEFFYFMQKSRIVFQWKNIAEKLKYFFNILCSISVNHSWMLWNPIAITSSVLFW